MTRLRTALRAAALTLLVVATAGAAAETIRLEPIDEGASDPTWPRFKARLVEALARHDQKFVLRIVDRNIRNISTTSGAAEFKNLWKPDAADSALWAELTKLLQLGGSFVKRERAVEFCAPYVYYKWPEHAPVDAGGAIVARDVLLQGKPAFGALTLATLSYDLVKVLDWEVADDDPKMRQKWVQIETAAGAGYVPEEQIRSPLEYRACFVRSGAGWRMTGLEVGE